MQPVIKRTAQHTRACLQGRGGMGQGAGARGWEGRDAAGQLGREDRWGSLVPRTWHVSYNAESYRHGVT